MKSGLNILISMILAGVLAVLPACRKKSDSAGTSPGPPRNIAYYDFIPDIVLQMPPSFTNTAEQAVDLDQDGAPDFNASLSHGVEYYGPHPYDTYDGDFSGTDSLVFLSLPYVQGPCNTPFDSSRYISPGYTGMPNFMALNIKPVSMINCCAVCQPAYIGFCMTKNSRKYCGWIRAVYNQNNDQCLRILDCAIDQTPGDSIRAGER